MQRIEPGPGQESVWDYPRPPAVDPTEAHVRVVHGGLEVVSTRAAIRILETSQPPAIYLPRRDCDEALLAPSEHRPTFCEWKGAATYWDLVGPFGRVEAAAWSYEAPDPRYASITGHLAFYAQRVDECWVDDEQVVPNEGEFYGGWITSRVVGPFKGGPGTWGW